MFFNIKGKQEPGRVMCYITETENSFPYHKAKIAINVVSLINKVLLEGLFHANSIFHSFIHPSI